MSILWLIVPVVLIGLVDLVVFVRWILEINQPDHVFRESHRHIMETARGYRLVGDAHSGLLFAFALGIACIALAVTQSAPDQPLIFQSVPFYCWVILGDSIICWVIVVNIVANFKMISVRAFWLVTLVPLLINSVIIVIGVLHNPTFTVLMFCRAARHVSIIEYSQPADMQPVFDELTPKARAEYDGRECAGDTYTIHPSDNTFYIVLGHFLEEDEACYQVTLIQVEGGNWLIDNFTKTSGNALTCPG